MEWTSPLAIDHNLGRAAALDLDTGRSSEELEALDIVGADRGDDRHGCEFGIGKDELDAIAAVELGHSGGERR